MRYPTNAELYYASKPPGPAVLHYRPERVTARQARLAGRIAYAPDIDLGLYRSRAVIDFIILRLSVGRGSQFRHVKEALERITGESAFVEPVDPGPGGVTREFDVTFQEPVLGEAYRQLQRLGETFPGLALDPVVVAAEFSIDFYSKTDSANERLHLVAVLSRHVFPAKNLPRNEIDGPRWVAAGAQTRHALRPNWTLMRDLVRFPFYDRQGIVDGTFYIGGSDQPLMWRVMHKTLDKQNPSTGAAELLDSAAQRARIEASLKSPTLKDLGVQTLSDLARMSFIKLQGRVFQFKLATFPDASSVGPVERVLEGYRVQRFLNHGLVGLALLDRERQYRSGLARRHITRLLRGTGKKLPAPKRIGSGDQGTYVSYLQLNDMVSAALENLGKRERRAWEALTK